MTIENSHINAIPTSIIPARVNIHHLQLRDLLQHSGVKDRVLFVSRLQVEQADFSLPHKSPSTYCTLDFQPNCLTTGCGLLATGGQHGELALRLLNHEAAEAQPTPWLLRTPTGGSINNAITIQSDLNHPLSSSSASTSNAYSRSNPDNKNQSAVVDTSGIPTSYSPWARDEPTSSSNLVRPGFLFGDEEMESELSQSVFEELAAAYGFDPSSVNRSSRWRRTPQTNTSITSSTTANTANSSATAVAVPPIQVMVSNNDQSIKFYKLQPPTLPSASKRSSFLSSSSPSSSSSFAHPIETSLPGLTRNTTLHFSTAINHSSVSPTQRTLIAVGDTPQVFIHSISPSGEHMKIATYTASSDACFSTTWSPDASKFAVASQDGVVSVWDVRSSKRLAGVSTSQGGGGGSGAARVVKWSPCGRYLAFTEHRNFWGVTDAVTFTQTQRIAAPSHLTSNSGGGNAGATLSSGVDVREGWIERRMAAEDRFRMVTGGEEAIARDRERRSMIHATFMREWNRAVNLVDSSSSSSSSSPSLTATNSSASTNNDSTNTNTMGFSRNSRGSNYYPPEFLVNPLATTATNSAGATSGVGGSGGVLGISRREDLLTAALTSGGTIGYRNSSYSFGVGGEGIGGSSSSSSSSSSSINISGLCWDPEGEHVYISTERVAAKYDVRDVRLSVVNADLL
ncbi:uncharacterized protein MEPE_05309 [Melanopsichium pennsylvanicum]|uniref:DUF2415 domain-containing protein n=1 Tax=Melanopsichium pennsylvanicum TaxID=63383 RepID=A0AAJ4XPW0_9BASI|nr:uncharacterized protein MEPE_05309 [Melanopsichium pennsylvanicum]